MIFIDSLLMNQGSESLLILKSFAEAYFICFFYQHPSVYLQELCGSFMIGVSMGKAHE
jgi:hypothetical protein